MPSPFPGMNPYFEQSGVWRGFHTGFLIGLRSAIVARLVPGYHVEVEESLYLERVGVPEDGTLFAVADTVLAKKNQVKRDLQLVTSTATTTATKPFLTTVPMPLTERKRRRWLTIRDSHQRQVVTVIEVLSPSDKRKGADRERYLTKRAKIFRSTASLVEIDLLRGGLRMPVDSLPACAGYVLVSRRMDRPTVSTWPFQLRDRLTDISIPLLGTDTEPVISLQEVLDREYDDGGYASRLYDDQLDPPLSAEDVAWVAKLISPLRNE